MSNLNCLNNNDTNLDVLESQNKLNRIPFKQRGFNIMDYSLWIALAIIGIALIIGLYGPLMTTTRSNSIISELNTFQLKIHEVYNGQNTGYSGISSAEVIKSNAYPTDLNSNGTTLSSTFAGTINITSDDGNGQTFTVEYAGVPSGVCRAVIGKLASAGGWSEIDVSGTAIWSGTSTTPTKSNVDSACNAGANVAMKFISN